MSQLLKLLLIQFLMPDNDARRQADDQIKRLAKDPQVIPALIHHLRTAKTPNVRQLAAVLLRKPVDEEQFPQMKNNFLADDEEATTAVVAGSGGCCDQKKKKKGLMRWPPTAFGETPSKFPEIC